jgi:hypothetical protein
LAITFADVICSPMSCGKLLVDRRLQGWLSFDTEKNPMVLAFFECYQPKSLQTLPRQSNGLSEKANAIGFVSRPRKNNC